MIMKINENKKRHLLSLKPFKFSKAKSYVPVLAAKMVVNMIQIVMIYRFYFFYNICKLETTYDRNGSPQCTVRQNLPSWAEDENGYAIWHFAQHLFCNDNLCYIRPQNTNLEGQPWK